MKDHIAIVTGASSGIGAAIAKTLSAAGATVIGTSRKQEGFARLDVTDAASCTALVAEVVDRHGRVDLLVNNAGFAQIGAFDAFSEDENRAAFETNLFGAMRMARTVLPPMRNAGRGRIVNICSVTSFLPAPYMGVYAATKHALQGFSTSLDHEVRGTGLRSLAVRPGFMRTSIGSNTVFAATAPGSAAGAVQQAVERSLSMADDPAVVARCVLRLATMRHPPAITDAGKEARRLRRLSTWLPATVFDRAFRTQFGLPPA
ncbi:SDR family NAD(P)-dependent oxidoreductase [uncultured Tateyamaria sp.]|uniref:SDR family NAD(P)-dependent oxidoreductase n=1 Tax=uncultured Tateyamaria sp. TaxID=455651 RepID=UPI00263672AE|nr:SDR family NAD(P)-dependent oxidoreductase [uncultured Tateyamaria sp.]